jgi:EAL domain-containing protein (putative c-di-GMP-specific phosphodiesterase class I)
VEEDRFFLDCQRVVPLASPGEDEYLELLLRLRDESGRVVPPGAFIPAAERFHLMGRVDRWVVARALQCLSRHQASGAAGGVPRFGINLSGMSLGDAGFADFVEERLALAAVAPGLVCFEITETAAISDLQKAARFIRRFRDLGCRFALDDFGTGLSSFAYLKALPVDYVKIDGGYVRGSGTDSTDLAVVEAIQRLARAVGARTVAESVEGPETLRRMANLGIDFGQGYAIHAPQAYRELAACKGYAIGEACERVAA